MLRRPTDRAAAGTGTPAAPARPSTARARPLPRPSPGCPPGRASAAAVRVRAHGLIRPARRQQEPRSAPPVCGRAIRRGRGVQAFTLSLPSLVRVRAVRSTSTSEPANKARHRDLDLQSVDNAMIQGPGGALVLSLLNRLGYPVDDGAYVEVWISALTLAATQWAVQRCLDTFTWSGRRGQCRTDTGLCCQAVYTTGQQSENVDLWCTAAVRHMAAAAGQGTAGPGVEDPWGVEPPDQGGLAAVDGTGVLSPPGSAGRTGAAVAPGRPPPCRSRTPGRPPPGRRAGAGR